MKRGLGLLGVTLTSMLLAINTVNATDLSNQIETNSAGLGNSITFEKSYDKDNDVTKVLVTLLVDENSIDTILNQKSGSGSNLSIFYFSLNPKLAGSTFKKNLVWVGDNLTHKTYESALNTLKTSVDSENAVAYSEIWPSALTVQYSIDNGKTWTTSTQEGNGAISIKEDLLAKLSLSDASDLVYGENFRFSMYDEYTQIWGWDALDADGTSLGKEYVAIDWEIKFPISGKIENEQVLFTTLDDAINSGSTSITVNENLVVNSNIEIPTGVTLTVADGITLEVKDGNTFVNNGTVLGTVKIEGVTKTYSTIYVEEAKNGTITVDKTNAATGDIVTVTTKANEGYKLKSIEVIDMSSNKVIEVLDGKFVMPENDVEVVALFENISSTNNEIVDNPKTFDNIMVYVIFGIAGFIAIIFNVKNLKLINK